MIQVESLQKYFTIHHLNKRLHAIEDISFTVKKVTF